MYPFVANLFCETIKKRMEEEGRRKQGGDPGYKPPSDITDGLTTRGSDLFTTGGLGSGSTAPLLSGSAIPLGVASSHMEVEGDQWRADNHDSEAADHIAEDDAWVAAATAQHQQEHHQPSVEVVEAGNDGRGDDIATTSPVDDPPKEQRWLPVPSRRFKS